MVNMNDIPEKQVSSSRTLTKIFQNGFSLLHELDHFYKIRVIGFTRWKT